MLSLSNNSDYKKCKIKHKIYKVDLDKDGLEVDCLAVMCVAGARSALFCKEQKRVPWKEDHFSY